MDWKVFHQYNFLADQGVVKPITCPSCDIGRVALTLDHKDEPAFKCFYCGGLTSVGLNRYDELKAVVKEFFE